MAEGNGQAPAPLFVPSNKSMEGPPDGPDAKAIADLANAADQLSKGNVKAALMSAADACNRISATHDLQGGAWY